MPESVNSWTPIPGSAGQLFHADPQSGFVSAQPGVGRARPRRRCRSR